MRFPFRTLLFSVLVLLLGASSVALAAPAVPEGAAPPNLRWFKGHNILGVRVLPRGDTQLDPERTVELLLDDGHYFRIRWDEPAGAELQRLRIRLPRIAARKASGWTLSINGRFCSPTGPCTDFKGEAFVPKGPRLSGSFSSVTVPPQVDLAPPTLTPQRPRSQSKPPAN